MKTRPDQKIDTLRALLTASLAVWALVVPSPLHATFDCGDQVLLPAAPTALSKPIVAFLRSKSPDYETVKNASRQLESIDTSSPAIRERLQPLIKALQRIAAELVDNPPSATATEAELQIISNKLRLLNTTSLRNLMGPGTERLQGRVGAAAWTFNRALWNKALTREAKIAEISLAMGAAKATPPPAVEGVPRPPASLNVKVVADDVMNVAANAVVASIECDGLCGSNIHSTLGPYVNEALKGRTLAEGDTLTVRASDGQAQKPKNFVLVVDDQRLPLRQLVSKALKEAEASGFTSIVLPAIRSGHAFGAVESSYEQLVAEMAAGVADFARESDGKLTDITVAVLDNGLLVERLRNALGTPKKERERSLREDLRPVSLSGKGFELEAAKNPPKVDTTKSPIYQTMLKPWDLAHMMEVHAPVPLGKVADRAAFSRPVASVLNMPIKMPGTGFRVPAELAQFKEFIQMIIDHEVAINPELGDFYAYITVDQHPVRKGATHRKGGIHIDGVQGARYPVKLPPEHTYSGSDTLGTVFYNQPFDLRALDPNRQHVHAEIERQAKPESRFVTEDYGLYFWDSYSAHEADVATKDAMRTFVRIEFSKKIYDGVGDTQSPLFDYNWPRVARPIPATLDDSPM